jgi:pyruvate dehydrogenase E2 component (dihydrolipoamide acetyltransferase)
VRDLSGRNIITVPDLGDFRDVEVIDVLVAVGDDIGPETPLVTLETDKATMDVPSSAAGRVVEVLVAKGSRVSMGDPVVALEATAAAGAGAPAPSATRDAAASGGTAAAPAAPVAAAPAAPPAPPAQPAARVAMPSGRLPPIEEAGFSRAHASPSVRRFARELGVDLGRVSGSGAKGRIRHDDVKAFVKSALAGDAGRPAGAALPAVPEVDFAAFGPVEPQPLTRIQRISGPRLHASWVNVPHVTQHDEADVTDMESLRGSLKDTATAAGVKLTPLAFIVRACARVLAAFPRFNTSLDVAGQNLVFKKYLHLGFAADTPNGLVVPVIRDVDRKDLYEIARELATLSDKARNGRLSAAEMQGGCFTVSSLGGIGGTAFTPIINAPEVAILGVSRARMTPVWQDGAFVPRLMLPLSLSYDHRVIDGADAARFTVALAAALADPRALLEAVP